MLGLVKKAVRRPLAIVAGGLLMGSTLVGGASAAAAQAPAPHWGNYQWFGGQEKASVRAFWLFDRTGDPTLNAIIKYVTDEFNRARTAHPELPYIAVYRDDAHAGQCFVNRTPGYSVASACTMRSLSAFGIKGLAATHGSPHFVGGAFAISDGLTVEDAVTAVCHNFGHVMGLADSDDPESCMNHKAPAGQIKWYGQGDTDAILDLYGHDDGQPPVAVDDTYSTAEDAPLTVNAPGVLGNDSDVDGDTLTAAKLSDPAHGDVTLNADGSFTYTPDPDFDGSDSFTYKASGGGADSAVRTVRITVTPVADAPVAVDDAYSTNEDTELTVPASGVLGNDTDGDGDTLSAAKLSDPAHGDVTLNADGSFTYTPDANYNGPDTFTYKANDDSTDSEVATVTVTVTAVNDAPVAVDDSYSVGVATAPGVLANDTDVEGSALTAIKVSDPSHGSVILRRDGSFVYTPNDVGFDGTDSFTYKANDGSTDSNVATVTIEVVS